MNRALFVLLIAVCLTALIAGFSIVGGPGFARMEQNDQNRADHLWRLGEYYRCADYALTEARKINSPTYCVQGEGPVPDLRDPLTDAPYRYEKTGEIAFEVCATFETERPETVLARRKVIAFDGQEGCVRYEREGPEDIWRRVS